MQCNVDGHGEWRRNREGNEKEVVEKRDGKEERTARTWRSGTEGNRRSATEKSGVWRARRSEVISWAGRAARRWLAQACGGARRSSAGGQSQ